MTLQDDLDADDREDLDYDYKAVDRLAYLRERIRRLNQEADLLRRQILAGEVSKLGDAYVARVERHVVVRPIEEP